MIHSGVPISDMDSAPLPEWAKARGQHTISRDPTQTTIKQHYRMEHAEL
jgi:hypothetical protein